MSGSDLARRAVAAKGWRWLPGMLTHWTSDAWRIVLVRKDASLVVDCPAMTTWPSSPCLSSYSVSYSPRHFLSLAESASKAETLVLAMEAIDGWVGERIRAGLESVP